MKKIFLPAALLSIFLFSFPSESGALSIWEYKDSKGNIKTLECLVSGVEPCSICEAANLAVFLANFLAGLGVIIVAGMAVLGGVKMLISGGSQQRFSSGKSTMTGAVWGFLIVVSAWLIIDTLIHVIVDKSAGLAPWNIIEC